MASSFNPLPNDKCLDMTKLKAFADNKYVAKMTISLCDRVENTVGKEENTGYQHFLLFPQCFPKPSSLTHYQTANFRLFKTERDRRRQFQI